MKIMRLNKRKIRSDRKTRSKTRIRKRNQKIEGLSLKQRNRENWYRSNRKEKKRNSQLA